MKLKVLPIILVILLNGSSYLSSQDLDFTGVLRGGVDDTEVYLRNYIGPFIRGFGYGFSNGWYNTAKPHRPLGFDLTATVNFALVPDSDLFFDSEGFENLTVAEGSNSLPTIFGPSSATTYAYNTTQAVSYIDPDPQSPTFDQTVTTEETITGTFEAPDGVDLEDAVGFSFVPVPMIQLGIGLIEKTDIKLRYLPPISTDDFRFNFFGVGIMHDFKQWTPGISHLPFDMSGFVGFTRLSAESDFTGRSDLGNPSTGGGRQLAGYEVTSLTFQVVASKSFSILTFYGGFGLSMNRSSLNLTGTYVIEGDAEIELTDGGTETVVASFEEVDPIDISINSNSPRATLGLRLKLLVLTINADYTLQEYNTMTVGLGFTVR